MHKSKGFTLVELVMAVVIAAIAVYALISVFINTSGQNAKLEAVSVAVHLANGKLEQVSSKSYANISSEPLTAFSGNFSNYRSLVVVSNVSSSEPNLSVGSTVTGYKKVTVYVSSSLLQNSVEVSTLITDTSNE